jgi:hypothetical protein
MNTAAKRLGSTAVVCLFLLGGCAGGGSKPTQTLGASPAVATTATIRNKLLGTWLYEYNGVTVEVTYTDTTVKLGGVEPAPYALNGNEITIDIVGPKTSIIDFTNQGEMVQTNKADGQRYVFRRKPVEPGR